MGQADHKGLIVSICEKFRTFFPIEYDFLIFKSWIYVAFSYTVMQVLQSTMISLKDAIEVFLVDSEVFLLEIGRRLSPSGVKYF